MFINSAARRVNGDYWDCFLALKSSYDHDSVLSQNTYVMVTSLIICSTRALCVYKCKVLWIYSKHIELRVESLFYDNICDKHQHSGLHYN